MQRTILPTLPLLLAALLVASCSKGSGGAQKETTIPSAPSQEEVVRKLLTDCGEEEVRSLMQTLRTQAEESPRDVFGLEVYLMPPSQYGYTNWTVHVDSPVLKQLDELHKAKHVSRMALDTEEWSIWAQFFGTAQEKDLCTECPFCRYIMRYGKEADSRFEGAGESDVGIIVPRYDVLAKDMGFLASRKDEISAIQRDTSTSVAAERTSFVAELSARAAPLVKASTISKDYDSNSIAAKEKYEGKLLRITGTIGSIGMSSPNWFSDTKMPHLTVGEAGWFGVKNSIGAYFPESSPSEFTSYSVGDTVTFTGTIKGIEILSPYAMDCALYSSEKTIRNREAIHEGMFATFVDSMRLRSGSSTDSPIIASLDKDSFVTVLETGAEATIDGIASRWVRVRVEEAYVKGNGECPAGTEGWCFGGYLYDYGMDTALLHFFGFEYP